MDGIELKIARNFSADAQELVTGRTCIIAQSGAGKSYLIAVLCEHLLRNNIAFCIIDTEGEYFSLKEKFEILWVGGEGSDLAIEGLNYAELAEKVIKENIPMILDVSDVMDERKVVAEFVKALYDADTRLRLPYLLILEEADKFVPQSKESMKEIEEISRRGRKRGLGLIVATQRPALVNKNVLSQCGNQFIGKLTTENDLAAVNLFFADRRELEDLPKLKSGEFFVMGNISKTKVKMKSYPRETQHKGLTPRLIPKKIGRIAEISAELKGSGPREVGVGEQPKGQPTRILPTIGLRIGKEDILKIVESKRRKKYCLFGKKEAVTGVELLQYPLIFVEVKRAEGFLKKGFRTYSFIIDGTNGKFAETDRGLRFRTGISQLIGLNESETRAMLEISRAKGITAAELGLRLGLKDSGIRSVINSLEARRFITYSGKDGRARTYVPLFKLAIPNVTSSVPYPAKEQKAPGRVVGQKVSEQALRDVLKALNPTTEIVRFDLFYYPVYSVHFSERVIKIDGVTGREVSE
ncbi:MAG: DUF87 domain-containing protein [Candidatus Aenigmatarchaeota archaeon]